MRFSFFAWRWKKCIVSIIIVCLVASTSLVAPGRSWALSLSDEKELGSKILEQIRERMPLVEDGEILTYVRSIGNRIVKQVGTTTYQYQFFVVNESIPNAFAIPGGYIFIYRGLIEMMTSEGELAGILSHELAHIQARHIHRRLEQQRILSIASIAGMLAGVFLGMKPEATQALAMGGIAGAQTIQLKYSRENEEEADQLGFRYLCAAGYPAKDMATAMRRLNQSTFGRNSKIPSYLSTHPALTERVEYLEELVRKEHDLASKPRRSAAVGDFAIMQAALVAEYSDPHIVMERFQRGVANGDTASIYGLGRLYVRQGNATEALLYLQKAARQEASSSLILSTLGAAYFQQGKLPEAQKALQTALLLDPSASIVHLRLAQVLQEQGQKNEALEHLQQIQELAPTFPEIDYQLGVVLGQVNRLGLAHLHLGRYYEHNHDWNLAFFHYSKAKALLLDSPDKLDELNRVLKEVEKRKTAAHWERLRK